jgi:hypothetical protein
MIQIKIEKNSNRKPGFYGKSLLLIYFAIKGIAINSKIIYCYAIRLFFS